MSPRGGLDAKADRPSLPSTRYELCLPFHSWKRGLREGKRRISKSICAARKGENGDLRPSVNPVTSKEVSAEPTGCLPRQHLSDAALRDSQRSPNFRGGLWAPSLMPQGHSEAEDSPSGWETTASGTWGTGSGLLSGLWTAPDDRRGAPTWSRCPAAPPAVQSWPPGQRWRPCTWT